MSATNILQQIQTTLTKKYNSDVEVRSDLDELFGPGFVNQYPDSDSDADPTQANAVDVPYKTTIPGPLPNSSKGKRNNFPLGEADGIDTEKETMAVADKALDAADSSGVEPSGDVDGDVGGDDMNMGDVGGVGGMDNMGMGLGEEEEKTPTELGRIYELKKIYTRLTSIESYLGNESDQELLEIRNYVSQGIELFEIVSANFNSYKDRLNEIIVMYYKFILEVYSSVKNFYSKQTNSGD